VFPVVQITLLNNGVPVAAIQVVHPWVTRLPLDLDESLLYNSLNLPEPGTDLSTPVGSGYSIQAVVDPANAVVEADETNNPSLAALNGATVPIFVPRSSGRAFHWHGDITEVNKGAWLPGSPRCIRSPVWMSSRRRLHVFRDPRLRWHGLEHLLSDLTAKHLADGASIGTTSGL
jgi:hypothetical protein